MTMVRALLLLLLLPALLPAAPAALLATPARTDDLAELMQELETRLDDADETLVGKVAAIGTRASMEALIGLYSKVHSVFMRREILRALPAYDGEDDAEQPALQKLLDVAVGERERELRVAALEGIDGFKGHGKTFLRMVVESSAMDEMRELALEMHVARMDDADLEWYRAIYLPPQPRAVKEDKKDRRRKKDDDADAPLVKLVVPLQTLRELAFGALSPKLTDKELLKAFNQDRNQKIKVAAMEELASRDYSGLEPLASEILDNISLPARMRAQAAEILADLRGPDVADLFIDLAKKQEVTQAVLRMRLAELLADMRDEKVDKKTEKLLGKGKPHQKAFALLASRYNENPKVVKKLVSALKDKDDATWRLAVQIAAERRFEKAGPELEKQLGKAKKDEERLLALLVALTAIKGGDAEWIAVLEGHAKGEAREVRNASLRALAQHGGEAYMGLLEECLGHADWSTRFAALKGLEALRLPAVVGPIIARMPEEQGRMLIEFADSLWRLTGKPYRTRARAWADWYEQDGADFELIEPKALAKIELEEENRRLRQITKVEFFGIRIESTRVIFIIDISGSMNETLRGEYVGRMGEIRMAVAKRELTNAVEALAPTALFNLVVFSSGVDTWIDGVVGANEKSREEAYEFIDRLGAGGATNLYEAIEVSFGDPDVDTIVILSDGEPTAGPVTQPGAIRADVARWNEHRGIKIHCVSVGGNLRVLEWLAEDNGGTYVEFQ